MKILGLHIRNTTNIGDRYCHPLDYYVFGCMADNNVHKISMTSKLLEKKNPEEILGYYPDVVFFGGGAVAKKCPDINRVFSKSLKIGWGIGDTRRNNFDPPSRFAHYNYRSGFALYGSRDYLPNSGIDYLPCVSCMHPFFDKIPDPTCNAVVYSHADHFNLRIDAQKLGLPYMDNKDNGGIISALSFIASGEIVITSSYHGAYWATLMGRKVAMIPFGSKFMGLKYKPTITKNVESGLTENKKYNGLLQEARNINFDFSESARKAIFEVN